MKKGIEVDSKTKKIVITNAFYKKSKDPTTDEFKRLVDTMEMLPHFEVEVKKAPNKTLYQKLNRALMLDFIEEKHIDVAEKWINDLAKLPFYKVKTNFYKEYEIELKNYLKELAAENKAETEEGKEFSERTAKVLELAAENKKSKDEEKEKTSDSVDNASGF